MQVVSIKYNLGQQLRFDKGASPPQPGESKFESQLTKSPTFKCFTIF